MPVDPDHGQAHRVKIKDGEDGKKVRVAKSGATIGQVELSHGATTRRQGRKDNDKKAAKGGAKGDAKRQGRASKPKAEAKPKGEGRREAGDKPRSPPAEGEVVERAGTTSPRMRVHYKSSVPALTKKFSYKNPMMVPRLQKVVVNMGLGAAVGNPKIIDSAVEDLRRSPGRSRSSRAPASRSRRSSSARTSRSA
jgi:hypothetical protein